MPIKINDSYITPAPLVSISKLFRIAGDGTVLGTTYDISLEGDLIPQKGNPIISGDVSSFSSDSWVSSYSSDDDPYTDIVGTGLLQSMMLKQEQIRKLFTPGSGVKVEILSFGTQDVNTHGIKFYGEVENVDFSSDGRWANPNKYTVSLKANNFIESVGTDVFSDNSTEDGFSYYIDSADETWDVAEGDFVTSNIDDVTSMMKTYKVSHSLSVQGKVAYDESGNYLGGLTPWQQASGYVHNVLGVGSGNLPDGLYIDPTISSFDGFVIANRTFTEKADIKGGTYSLDEEFLLVDSGVLASGFVEESVTVDVGESNNSSLKTVSINGTIQGLSLLTSANSGVDNYDNALTYYNNLSIGSGLNDKVYSRAKNLSGYSWINPKPLNTSISKDFKAGTIDYSCEYDTRFPTVVSGSISESISISNTYPGQIFSTTPVIGRSQPVLQYMNSRSEYRRSLNIDVIMPIVNNFTSGDVDGNGYWSSVTTGNISSWLISQNPSVVNSSGFQNIFESVNPANEAGVIPNKTFYSAPQESWNPFNGQYSYSIEWTYEKE